MESTSTSINRTQIGPEIFAEFLEVAIHSILYNRDIYPSGVFERRKKYNVPVQMCLHPDVTDYVAKVTDGVKVMVQEGNVEKVTMVILNMIGHPVERFVFEIDRPSNTSSEDKYLFSLEESLRAFLLRLNICDSLLKPLPEECSWVIHVHTKESTADKLTEYQNIQHTTIEKILGKEDISHLHQTQLWPGLFSSPEHVVLKDFRWIPADLEQTNVKDASILPLKSLTNDIIKMQMYVEESGCKET